MDTTPPSCCLESVSSLRSDLSKIQIGAQYWKTQLINFNQSKISGSCQGCRKVGALHFFLLVRKYLSLAKSVEEVKEVAWEQILSWPLVCRKNIMSIDLKRDHASTWHDLPAITESCKISLKPRPLDSNILLYQTKKNDSSFIWIGIAEKRISEILALSCLMDILPDPKTNLIMAEIKLSDYKAEQFFSRLFDREYSVTTSQSSQIPQSPKMSNCSSEASAISEKGYSVVSRSFTISKKKSSSVTASLRSKVSSQCSILENDSVEKLNSSNFSPVMPKAVRRLGERKLSTGPTLNRIGQNKSSFLIKSTILQGQKSDARQNSTTSGTYSFTDISYTSILTVCNPSGRKASTATNTTSAGDSSVSASTISSRRHSVAKPSTIYLPSMCLDASTNTNLATLPSFLENVSITHQSQGTSILEKPRLFVVKKKASC